MQKLRDNHVVPATSDGLVTLSLADLVAGKVLGTCLTKGLRGQLRRHHAMEHQQDGRMPDVLEHVSPCIGYGIPHALHSGRVLCPMLEEACTL